MKYIKILKESFGIKINGKTIEIEEIDYKETFKHEHQLLSEIIEQIEMSGTDLWENELNYFKMLKEIYDYGNELSELFKLHLIKEMNVTNKQNNLSENIQWLIDSAIDYYGIEIVLKEFGKIKEEVIGVKNK